MVQCAQLWFEEEVLAKGGYLTQTNNILINSTLWISVNSQTDPSLAEST